MEQLATPGSIRLTAETLRLAEGLVQVMALGPVPVKGAGGAGGGVRARRRHGPAADTNLSWGLSPFVGRQAKLETLRPGPNAGPGPARDRWSPSGEPGVTMSPGLRVPARAPHAGLAAPGRQLCAFQQATAYLPVCDLLKAYCHIEDRDDLRTVRAKITGQILTLDDALQDTVPAVLALFEALPADSPFYPWILCGGLWKTLKRVLLRESQIQPLLLVFEDLHWIDSETQAVLDSLVESLPTARVPCSWSTTAPSTSTAGAVKPSIPTSGSTPSPRRTLRRSCRPSLATAEGRGKLRPSRLCTRC